MNDNNQKNKASNFNYESIKNQSLVHYTVYNRERLELVSFLTSCHFSKMTSYNISYLSIKWCATFSTHSSSSPSLFVSTKRGVPHYTGWYDWDPNYNCQSASSFTIFSN